MSYLSVLTLGGGVLAADQTFTGAISDKMCGANHKAMGPKMMDRECTQACAKGGTPYVLVADRKLYHLTSNSVHSAPDSEKTRVLTVAFQKRTLCPVWKHYQR